MLFPAHDGASEHRRVRDADRDALASRTGDAGWRGDDGPAVGDPATVRQSCAVGEDPRRGTDRDPGIDPDRANEPVDIRRDPAPGGKELRRGARDQHPPRRGGQSAGRHSARARWRPDRSGRQQRCGRAGGSDQRDDCAGSDTVGPVAPDHRHRTRPLFSSARLGVTLFRHARRCTGARGRTARGAVPQRSEGGRTAQFALSGEPALPVQYPELAVGAGNDGQDRARRNHDPVDRRVLSPWSTSSSSSDSISRSRRCAFPTGLPPASNCRPSLPRRGSQA